ncbi:MAG: DUF4202 domain-containing protein [Hyphomicrobiaceae bacterium]|nr:DUF4202 domain-containing protein [Hyphomicrobiaceae bacterium]
MTSDRLSAVYAAIDAANADDPRKVAIDGSEIAHAVIYGQRMTAALAALAPDASEVLRIACRAQHLRRFDLPRSSYPMDKPGYHAWRNAQKIAHAEKAGALMAAIGYGDEDIARVGSLIRKERLKRDAEAQTLEDVACLVFLEHEFVDFAAPHDDAKVIDIVAKTWVKMSPRGHAAALALAPKLPERLLSLVQQAISGAG